MTTPALYVEINGHRATEEDLRIPAFADYGHFTAMQIRDHKVRGLALHLERLSCANRELFALPLDGDHVRALIRHALAGAGYGTRRCGCTRSGRRAPRGRRRW